jgi:signal peptidase II
MQLKRRFLPERQKLPYLAMALVVLALDQWSKWQVETHLPRGSVREVIPGFLNLTHVKNTGVAFGLFASGGDLFRTVLLSLLGLVALGIVAHYFRRTPSADRWLLTALGLILGGAVGNITDRVVAGEVTDFIDAYVGTYHWHTFNVADSAISIGIFLMILDVFRPRPNEEDDG